MIDFMLFGGYAFRQTNERMDIGGCRVAFATENRNFICFNLKVKLSRNKQTKTGIPFKIYCPGYSFQYFKGSV